MHCNKTSDMYFNSSSNSFVSVVVKDILCFTSLFTFSWHSMQYALSLNGYWLCLGLVSWYLINFFQDLLDMHEGLAISTLKLLWHYELLQIYKLCYFQPCIRSSLNYSL